ncbi:MAG: type III pantothenate kinase [Erysipelotrichaceae bacterium]
MISLAIDMGNSNIVCGIYNNGLVASFRFETDKLISLNDCVELLEIIHDKYHYECVGFSCVVPRLYRIFSLAISSIVKDNYVVINNKNIDYLDIRLDNPKEIGADFICGAIGACNKYEGPILISDLGTCNKVLLVEDNVFYGGAISPGIGQSFKTMIDNVSQLPKISYDLPKKVIGNNTIDALKSGSLYGTIAAIEGLNDKMEKEYGKKCKRVLTGGYATILNKSMPDFIYDPNLLIDGIQVIIEKKFNLND